MEIGEQTRRSLQTHAFSGKRLHHYPLLVQALLQVKWAAAQANRDLEVVSVADAHQLGWTCDRFLSGDLQSHVSQLLVCDVMQGGGGIGIHMNISEALSNASGIGLATINASQSTADVCATAMRLSLLTAGKSLTHQLVELAEGFRHKFEEFRGVRTMARTCLRDASATTLGENFRAFADVVQRRQRRLADAIDSLCYVNLGGTAIGSGEGAPVRFGELALHYLAQRSRCPLTSRENLYDAAQNADDLGAVSHELSLLAEVLIKIAHDIRLLASGPSAGFGELVLPAIIQGSSFYPGKVNPTLLETLLQCCFDLLGKHRSVQACLEHAELNLNVFETMAGTCIHDAFGNLERCLRQFHQHCLPYIEADEARCASYAEMAAHGYARTY